MATSLTSQVNELRAQALAVPEVGRALEVSLVTVSPGHGAFEWLGHSAILVANHATGESRVYQYGVMDASRETFIGALTGRLYAYANAIPSSVAMARYATAHRSVHLQELALSDAQKLDMLRLLNNDVLGRKLRQRYRVATDNCSTRPRDLIDRVTNGALRAAGSTTMPTTVRENVLLLPNPPPIKIALDFLFQGDIDRPASLWEEASLPVTLEQLVARTDLVAHAWSIGDEPRDPIAPPSTRGMLELGFILSIALALLQFPGRFGTRRAAVGNTAAALIVGLPGLLLALGWLTTDYEFLARNQHLLAANPLVLVTIPLVLRHRAIVAAKAWMIAGAISVAGMFFADNLRFHALLLPILATQCVVLWINASRREEKHAPSQPAPTIITTIWSS